jgi:vacuolar protein sorting-associated protein 26
MAAYFFASPIDVDIKLDGEEARKLVEIKAEKEKTVQCPVYYDGDNISGQVRAQPRLFLYSFMGS